MTRDTTPLNLCLTHSGPTATSSENKVQKILDQYYPRRRGVLTLGKPAQGGGARSVSVFVSVSVSETRVHHTTPHHTAHETSLCSPHLCSRAARVLALYIFSLVLLGGCSSSLRHPSPSFCVPSSFSRTTLYPHPITHRPSPEHDRVHTQPSNELNEDASRETTVTHQ